MNPKVSEVLKDNDSGLHILCKKYGVSKLWLFGSALSELWDPKTSDLDLLVEFDCLPAGIDLFAQIFVFQVELERLFNRPVDLVERVAIRKQEFLKLVDSEALEIYAA
jgi:predicted nucleotidyltransferase